MPQVGDKAAMLDPWLKNPVEGKIVGLYETGATLECPRGVRYFGSFDRLLTRDDLFKPPARVMGEVYVWKGER